MGSDQEPAASRSENGSIGAGSSTTSSSKRGGVKENDGHWRPAHCANRPEEHSYPDAFEARRVRKDGGFKWAGSQVFVGEAFGGEVIGLEAVDDALWHVHLGPLRLGVLHGRSRTIVPIEPTVTHVPGHADR